MSASGGTFQGPDSQPSRHGGLKGYSGTVPGPASLRHTGLCTSLGLSKVHIKPEQPGLALGHS